MEAALFVVQFDRHFRVASLEHLKTEVRYHKTSTASLWRNGPSLSTLTCQKMRSKTPIQRLHQSCKSSSPYNSRPPQSCQNLRHHLTWSAIGFNWLILFKHYRLVPDLMHPASSRALWQFMRHSLWCNPKHAKTAYLSWSVDPINTEGRAWWPRRVYVVFIRAWSGAPGCFIEVVSCGFVADAFLMHGKDPGIRNHMRRLIQTITSNVGALEEPQQAHI